MHQPQKQTPKLHAAFLAEVEEFLVRTGQSASGFGRNVMGDPSFVFALKKGRSPNARTIEFVRNHIAKVVTP